MAFHRNLLQIAFLFTLASSAASAAVATETSQVLRPDCAAKCGNVSIPYPFGTSKNCSLNQYFIVTCNEPKSNSPKLILGNSKKSNVEILDLSINGSLTVHTYIARRCYNQNGSLARNHNRASANLRKFPFSVTRNKFVAVGCDTYGYIFGPNGQDAAICMSICNSIDSVTDGLCNGIGCCETSIPKELLKSNVTVGSLGNHSLVWSENPCSYSFLVEKEAFNFSKADLKDLQNRSVVPSVLDWTVSNQNCEEAKKNLRSYACKENSNCSNSDNGPGYRCGCKAGYQGNPYLPGGCTDIDECLDTKLNQCKKICINTVGNYTCGCPKGQHGDGRKDGEGCSPESHDQLLVVKIVVGIGGGLIVLLAAAGWSYLILRKRKLMKLKEKYFQQNGGLMLQQRLPRREGSSDTAARIFSAEELKNATNNYDETKIVGQGGYGTVYKGTLPDNNVVAIKKSKIVDRTQIEQFINEVVVLSQINHRNVVRLQGCCLETEVPLLVYEFVSNGTLFDHIHNAGKVFDIIPWDVRLRIAAETAGVLSYLHSQASIPIIHRDVKSTNILLDNDFTAKVSDFGASRLVPIDQAQLSTLVQGTLGYLDPEYLHTSQLSEKSDVYSFGVVLVELLTGRKALAFDRPEEERSLAMYFVSSLKEGRLLQVLDDNVVNGGGIEQLEEVAKVARSCLSIKGEERPSMKEVAMELEGLRAMAKHPWANVEANSGEETEYLLGEASDCFNYADSNNSTGAGYDSIRNHVILSVSSDGR